MITNTKHELITNTHYTIVSGGMADGAICIPWWVAMSAQQQQLDPHTHTHGPTLDWWTQTHTHNGLTNTLNRRASVHTHGPTQSHSLKLTVMEMHLHCFGQLYKLLPWVYVAHKAHGELNMELTGQYNLHNDTSWHTDKEHCTDLLWEVYDA